MGLALVTIAWGAPNIPRSYLPPAADPPAPECRTVTEEQEQEVQEQECTVKDVEKCDSGMIYCQFSSLIYFNNTIGFYEKMF